MTFLTTGASVKGTSHNKSSTPCQDANCIKTMGEFTILAVADGHGSEKCKYSNIGSKKAVNSFCDIISKLIKNASVEDAHKFFSRNKDDIIPKNIYDEWLTKIQSFHKKNFPNEVFDAVLYGTTLVGLVITPTFAFGIQVGDGDILCVRDNKGSIDISHFILTEKILGTETNSLSSNNAWKKAITRVNYYSNEEDLPILFMISTDGMINSFTTESGFYACANDYLDIISEHGFECVVENIKRWLKETTENGCGDDVSLVLAVKKEISNRKKIINIDKQNNSECIIEKASKNTIEDVQYNTYNQEVLKQSKEDTNE